MEVPFAGRLAQGGESQAISALQRCACANQGLHHWQMALLHCVDQRRTSAVLRIRIRSATKCSGDRSRAASIGGQDEFLVYFSRCGRSCARRVDGSFNPIGILLHRACLGLMCSVFPMGWCGLRMQNETIVTMSPRGTR